MPKADHKGRSKGATQPFVQVLKPTLQEPAWKALPYGARCLYITLKSFFTGSNNGRLYLSVRKAADELGASSTSTERWFQDLIKHGFIVPTAGGFLGAEGSFRRLPFSITLCISLATSLTMVLRFFEPLGRPFEFPDFLNRRRVGGFW